MRTSPPILAREIALSDPLVALERLADLPHPFLFHSSLPGDRARWSFFGADPFATFTGDRAAEAAALWREARTPRAEGSPAFTGGLVGYWAYDYGRRLERLPSIARDDLGLPDMWLAAHDVVGAFEHASGRAWIFSSGRPARGAEREARAVARLDAMARRLERAAATPAPRAADPGREPLLANSTFTPADYRAAVERIRELIRRGDLFQANLSQRWSLARDPSEPTVRFARALFVSLAERSPAPFAAYLDCGDHAIASASPERFLELREGSVETRPIKGTRPRGLGPIEDAALREALLHSAKDRAENVMIVDVLRNDLGRVCETGSVAVPELCALETFPQVFHLTSTVTGTLRAGRDALDLLHACFPGGSITGAPKIRAMEILESLEPVRRHLYTGAIGWLDWNGDADWNIAIRTATVTRDEVQFAAGGGITIDSDPEAEYVETLDKAEGMRAALAPLVGDVMLTPRDDAASAVHTAASGGTRS
jgi:para-aminobenzoate synthetase component 1